MLWPFKRDQDAVLAALEELREAVRVSPVGPGGSLSPEVRAADLEELSDRLDGALAAISQLRHDHAEIRGAVATAIEHEERREKRIKATVRRARKELANHELEDPALESEWDGLQLVHDLGDDGLPPGWSTRDDEWGDDDGAGSAEEPSSIKGVSRAQLQRARGF